MATKWWREAMEGDAPRTPRWRGRNPVRGDSPAAYFQYLRDTEEQSKERRMPW